MMSLLFFWHACKMIALPISKIDRPALCLVNAVQKYVSTLWLRRGEMKKEIPTQNLMSCGSWRLMGEIKSAISRKRFMECLGVGSSQENRFCLPADNIDYRRNPADRIQSIVEALVQNGESEMAQALVNYIAQPLKCRVTPIQSPTPDKEYLADECVDDYCAKSKLDVMMRAGQSLEDVMQQAERCRREIDETIVLYKEECKNKGRY